MRTREYVTHAPPVLVQRPGTTPPAAVHEPPTALPRPLAAALWLSATAVLAGWIALAIVHLTDGYRVTHAQGVWIALVEGARTGALYPPLFDGESYAGTRYMPLPILLNAAASAAAGGPLIGGKALAAGLMAVLLVLMVITLRRVACPWPLTGALPAMVVGTEAGLQAGTTIGGDLLPVVLQLGALLTVLHSTRRRALMAAGILAGLAAASKLTGLWGGLAIITWLHGRGLSRPAATVAGTSVATALLVLGIVQAVSGGGLSAHLSTFAMAGVAGPMSLLRAPNQLLYQLTGHASGAVVLLPLAIVGALLAGGWRRQHPIHVALAAAALLVLSVYTDVGTGYNQLLDLIVLTALAAGTLAGRVSSGEKTPGTRAVLLVVAATVGWAAGIDLVRTVGRDLRGTAAVLVAGAERRPDAQVVAEMLQPDESVLAEDPAVEAIRGRRPAVMDPFMLARLERTRPELIDPLLARIERREFALVALVVRLENRDADFWWAGYAFGPRVARALRASYRPAGKGGRYHLYRPAE